MCGRFALHANPELVALHFGLPSVPRFAPRYNICPGTQILAVRSGGARLFPWSRIANARSETVAHKPMFASAFRGWRCLVPASGFYEWKNAGGRKQPYYARPKDRPLFALAAIVVLWKAERGISLVTTTANELMGSVHERMPVIIAPEEFAVWLDAQDPQRAQALMRPYPPERMEAYPVGPRVNRPEHDDASLIEGVSLPA